MKLFRIKCIEKLSEFPYEFEHFYIVCAEDKEQAKNLVSHKVKSIKELHIKKPDILFYTREEVE